MTILFIKNILLYLGTQTIPMLWQILLIRSDSSTSAFQDLSHRDETMLVCTSFMYNDKSIAKCDKGS